MPTSRPAMIVRDRTGNIMDFMGTPGQSDFRTMPRETPRFSPIPIPVAPRRGVQSAPIPLGQAKRRPYNAAMAARPSELINSLYSGHDIPEAGKWVTGAREKRADIMQTLQRAMTMPRTEGWSVPAGTTGGGGGGEFGRLVNAIARKESEGNYSAVNRSSGALGKYQIMPGNVGPWSREVLGRSVSTSEFLRNPQLQDAIATAKLRQYYQKYGAAGAATAWYAGPGAVTRKMGSTRAQGAYPSINSYWQSILGMM